MKSLEDSLDSSIEIIESARRSYEDDGYLTSRHTMIAVEAFYSAKKAEKDVIDAQMSGGHHQWDEYCRVYFDRLKQCNSFVHQCARSEIFRLRRYLREDELDREEIALYLDMIHMWAPIVGEDTSDLDSEHFIYAGAHSLQGLLDNIDEYLA